MKSKMKKKSLTHIITMSVALLVFMAHINAQDVLKTNPTYSKLLADTAGVRMMKVTLAPGEEMAMHTHPVQILYCIEGGQITVHYKNGKTETFELNAGDAMQAPPDPPHTTKNTGTKTLSFLEIEIKGMKNK